MDAADNILRFHCRELVGGDIQETLKPGRIFGTVLVGWVTTKTGSMTYGIFGRLPFRYWEVSFSLFLPKITTGHQYKAAAHAPDREKAAVV